MQKVQAVQCDFIESVLNSTCPPNVLTELTALANEVSSVQNVATVNVEPVSIENLNASKTSVAPKLAPAAASMVTAKVQKAQIHHIATDKNNVSPKGGGPWTPRFREMFEKAGMDISKDSANHVSLPGHKANHPAEYHQEVFDRLSKATKDLSGTTYKDAFKAELAKLKKEISTPGSRLNKQLTESRGKETKDNSKGKSGGGSSISREQRNNNRSKN
ncbi:AHH domain-containing protein [Silvanigrella aquatica]|uniref:Uncharacterized protein n=1 Tax=Silvanigrella aquatica TaxID=1915309 RepID=A0A1L4D1W8_9BACT|nr:AHH domain-containing protein [Silvanigrella aquatica]APJ04188.1 hypothetical protein AXG55_09835 [Silvanigrella aquatica]